MKRRIQQATYQRASQSLFGISSFIEEANKYKNEDLDIDINDLISSAIKGNIDNKTLGEKILSILFGEVQEAIALFYERLYILGEEFSIKEYNKFLAEEINERNDENFTKGAKLSIELLNYYDESIEKLTNRASAMTKKIK